MAHVPNRPHGSVRGSAHVPNRPRGSVCGSAKRASEPHRTKPQHHYRSLSLDYLYIKFPINFPIMESKKKFSSQTILEFGIPIVGNFMNCGQHKVSNNRYSRFKNCLRTKFFFGFHNWEIYRKFYVQVVQTGKSGAFCGMSFSIHKSSQGDFLVILDLCHAKKNCFIHWRSLIW